MTPEIEYYNSPFLLIDLSEEYEKKMPELKNWNLMPLNILNQPPHLDFNCPPGVFQQDMPNPLVHQQNPLPLTNQSEDTIRDQFLNNNDDRYKYQEEILDEFLHENNDMDIEFNADNTEINNILYFSLNENVHNILLQDITVMDNEFSLMYEYDYDPIERFHGIELYK
jgi:hypothetical protein